MGFLRRKLESRSDQDKRLKPEAPNISETSREEAVSSHYRGNWRLVESTHFTMWHRSANLAEIQVIVA